MICVWIRTMVELWCNLSPFDEAKKTIDHLDVTSDSTNENEPEDQTNVAQPSLLALFVMCRHCHSLYTVLNLEIDTVIKALEC